MMDTRTSRRGLFRAAGALAVSGGVLAAAGCGDDGPADTADDTTTSPHESAPPAGGGSSGASGPSGTAKTGATLPTHIPRTDLPAPDIDAIGGEVPAMYYAYPDKPAQLYSEPPLDGGSLNGANEILRPPTPMGKNSFWQELNKRLGITLNMQMVPASQYDAKAATMIAGGDLPDFMPMHPSISRASYLELLKAKFEDLTPYLAGDAIADYPNLAALPSTAWKAVSIDGHIYSMPYTVPAVSALPTVRQDLFDKMGLSAAPEDGKAFLDLCREITDEKSSRWAFGRISEIVKLVHDMAGVPNQWRVEDGAFTSQFTTPEYKDFLTIMRGLWDKGYFEPDSPTALSGQVKQWFNSGRILIRDIGYAAWYTDAQAALPENPDYRLGGLLPPKWEGGGQATYSQGNPGSSTTTLKKGSPTKIKQILRVLDFLASPFGSAEYLFNQFGVADQDYTLSGSDPVETTTGVNQCQAMNLAFVVRTLAPVYLPGQNAMAKSEHEFMAKLAKVSAPRPTVGLISATDLAKGASVTKPLDDLQNDIILGRKPVSAWDSAVKTWLSAGGEQIGREYEEAYAHENG